MIKPLLLIVIVILNISDAYKIVSDLEREEMEHWAVYDRVGRYLSMRQAMMADDTQWLPNSNKIGLGYNPVRYS